MKKLLYFLMLGIILASTSCTKEQNLSSDNGKSVKARISVQLPSLATKTRAAFDNPALNDMRVVMAVMFDDVVVHSETKTGQALGGSGSPVDFDLRLVSGRDYKVAVWADFGPQYYTVSTEVGTAPKVAMASTTINGSNNKYDAYFKIENITFTTSNQVKPFELKRPFGLVKINTLDYNEGTVKNARLRPQSYNIASINIPTQLSLIDGSVGEMKDIKVDWSSVSSDYDVDFVAPATSKELSFDYIFAGEVQSPLANFTAAYRNESQGDIVSYEFTNIPIRRNFITNITGNILTKKGSIRVSIDPMWETPVNNIILIDASTSLAEAIKQESERLVASGETGSVVFNVNYPIDEGNVNQLINILDVVDGSKLTNIIINLHEGVTASKLTITDEHPLDQSSNYTGNITLNINGVCESLDVNLPNGSFTLASGQCNNISVTTKPDTFTVSEGTSIKNLTVHAGGILVLGTVETLFKSNSELISVEGAGRIETLVITNDEGIVLPFVDNVTKIGNIELKSTGNIVVDNAPYTGFVKVSAAPKHLLVKSGYVSYEGSKYSPDYISNLTNKWYGFGFDLGTDGLSLVGIPRYLGLYYMGAKADFTFGAEGLTAKKLTEVKFTVNGATAACQFELGSIVNAQDIEKQVNEAIAKAMKQLPTEAEIRAIYNKYAEFIPASEKAKVEKAINDAINLIYYKLGTGVSIPGPTIDGMPVATYFRSDDNLSSAKIEQINNGLKLILEIINSVVDAEAALESIKAKIAALDAEIARLDAVIADYDAQIAAIDGPVITTQKRIATILGTHNILIGIGNATKRAQAVAELDALNYAYNQGITKAKLLDYKIAYIADLNKAAIAQSALVANMEVNGSPATADLKAQKSTASRTRMEVWGNLIATNIELAATQKVVDMANQAFEDLGLKIDMETLTKILKPMIAVLDVSIKIIQPVEQFVDSVNPWVYTGSIKSNEVVTTFKVNVKLGDIVEVEKSR